MWKTLVASVALLLVGGTAHAAPPRAGLCEGLKGKAYSNCLYSDLDDRLRALEGKPSPTTAPTTAPPTTAPPSQVPENGDWLSGAAGPEAANGTFGVWRGSKVEIGTTWVNDAALWTLLPGAEWGSFSGPMSISASPPTWSGWANEANGANDAYWTALARKAKELRGGKGQTYINPYYEFNGDWMKWSVVRTAQGQADFRAGFARTSAILKREFPGVKVVINPGAGRTVPADMWPSSSAFDVVGIDIYNEWPWCGTTACVPDFLARIAPLQKAAKDRGKPIAFPEWGNSSVAAPGGGGGGESPVIIDAYHKFFADNAGTGPGQVVYETYFNIGNYPARFELFTNGRVNTTQPRTAAQYVLRF